MAGFMRSNGSALFVFFLQLYAFPAFLQADQRFEVVGKSSVRFLARITGGSFVTESSKVEGFIQIDDAGTKLVSAEISVPVQSLDSGLSMRNNHMQNKYLEAAKYPKIIFTAKDSAVVLQSGAQNKLPGEFTIK